MTHKERALKKLRLELEKDVAFAVEMARLCGALEILYIVYLLRAIRLSQAALQQGISSTTKSDVFAGSREDSLKYAIALTAKYGAWEMLYEDSEERFPLNAELIDKLLSHVSYINSKYETEAIVHLFDVEVFGERDQHIKFDMSNIERDAEARKFQDYFLRVDHDNEVKKRRPHSQADLLQNFRREYLPVADLFEQEIGVSLDEFCVFNQHLLEIFVARIEAVKPELDKLPNGNVNLRGVNTFLRISSCFMFDSKELFELIPKKFHRVVERLTFNPALFDENQLRFHQVTRTPIIRNKELLVVSPELVLDSLFTNTHYSLLESTNTKAGYKAKQASHFLDKLVEIASKHGYVEVERERELFEGKNQIGDIDLILKMKPELSSSSKRKTTRCR